jgi:hypothetical protein
VVRAIGSDLPMDYTAVGQTTLLAARMEQLADPGSIAIAPETLALAEGYVEVRSLGRVPVKGLDAPVETYELVGAGPRRSRLAASADRGLTKFVGRDAELEQLRQALGRAATGHGQVVALVGEAGVGKSRLVWEEVHAHRTHGWLIVQASSISYGSSMPYLPLLRAYCQIDPRDDARKVREKLTGNGRLTQALRRLGGVLMSDGQYARAAEYEEEVLALPTVRADAEVRIAAAWQLGMAESALGRYREAIARLAPIADGPDAEVATSLLGGSTQALRSDVRVAGVVSRGPREVRGGPAIRGPRRRVGTAVLAPPDAGFRRERASLRRCLSGTVRRGHSSARAGPA